jgi:hypothetical protein
MRRFARPGRLAGAGAVNRTAHFACEETSAPGTGGASRHARIARSARVSQPGDSVGSRSRGRARRPDPPHWKDPTRLAGDDPGRGTKSAAQVAGLGRRGRALITSYDGDLNPAGGALGVRGARRQSQRRFTLGSRGMDGVPKDGRPRCDKSTRFPASENLVGYPMLDGRPIDGRVNDRKSRTRGAIEGAHACAYLRSALMTRVSAGLA